MSDITATIYVVQGRALPITGLKCTLYLDSGNVLLRTTDGEGKINAILPANSRIKMAVQSKTSMEVVVIGELELGPDSYTEQYFTAVVDLTKVFTQTKAHPKGTEQAIFPKTRIPSRPINRAPSGSNDQDSQGVPAHDGMDPNGNPLTKVNAQNATQVTLPLLRKLWPSPVVTNAELQCMADEVNTNPSRYKLDTPLRKAHFFAQIMAEAGGNLTKVEILNYSVAALIGLFSYFGHHKDEAALYGRHSKQKADQMAIANRIYSNDGNKHLGNGSVASGDGWKYRGRGYKQVTGRSNYTQFNTAYPAIWPGDKLDFVGFPDFILEPKYAMRSAIWFWLANKLYEIADEGADISAVDKITKKINSGLITSYNKEIQLETKDKAEGKSLDANRQKKSAGYQSVSLRRRNFKLTYAVFK